MTLQEQQRAELRIINNALVEETSARENCERRLSELRTDVSKSKQIKIEKKFKHIFFIFSQLERLQAENAAEWGKRERLETEKLALERDNKKIRGEMRDWQDRAERRGGAGGRPATVPVTSNDAEFRALQQELAEKNKVCFPII